MKTSALSSTLFAAVATRRLVLIFGLILVGGCRSQEAEDTEADKPDAAATALPSSEPDALGQETLTELEQALEHEDMNRRLDVAWGLTGRQDVPGPVKAQLLLDTIEREISAPTPGPPQHGSYLSDTERLKFVYTRALSELDDEALETVRRAAEDETGELRARALLALGFAGQPDVVPGLRELLQTSANGEVRADAAYLLGVLEAHEATADLQGALADPYLVMVEGLGGASELYPVREQALGALEELGLTVELTEDGEYRVLER